MRRGIEQGEYVYRRGDLLFGPGDPPAEIAIDEQSVVFTMVYARNMEIWPCPKVAEPAPPVSPPAPGGEGGGLSGGAAGETPPPESAGGSPSERERASFTAEGLLMEALVRLWEQVRAGGVDRIGVLTIRMFEAGDAFRFLGAVGALSGADKTLTIEGGYETRNGGSFELEFRGPVADAQPVREFIESQLRAASARTLQAGFELVFAEGLAMQGDAAEKLTERLSRFASGAAYVSASAEAKEE